MLKLKQVSCQDEAANFSVVVQVWNNADFQQSHEEILFSAKEGKLTCGEVLRHA